MTLTKFWMACAFLGAASFCSASDYPLANLIGNLKNRPSSEQSPILVSAVGLVQGSELNLKFTLTNVSTVSLSVSPDNLPWGNTYAIRWAALTSDGHVLPLAYPIDDPIPIDKVKLSSKQTLIGTYHLSSMLIREKIPADSDIAIVWVYRFSADPLKGQDSRPIATGIAVLHTPK